MIIDMLFYCRWDNHDHPLTDLDPNDNNNVTATDANNANKGIIYQTYILLNKYIEWLFLL